MKRLGILLSGRGSNFLAIAEACQKGILRGKAEIAIVISNVADAAGLARAQALGFPTALFESKGRKRVEHDADVLACLLEREVDLVILAGYMRLISQQFTNTFKNQILNIHPSLLPAFPGLEAQRQAFEHGCQVAGCTVHFVDEHLDGGIIVLQRCIPVHNEDDLHSLTFRILLEEHEAYPAAIERVLSGEYGFKGRRFVRQPR